MEVFPILQRPIPVYRRIAPLFAWGALAFGQANDYNPIYRGEAGDVFSRKPNAFLVEMTRGRKPGKALDVGMGQGRNTIYLAEHRWEVTGFDPADEGVRLARLEAARLGLRITALVTTHEEFDFGENQWDLIVMTYVPTRRIAPKVMRALRPGGAVLVEDRHNDTGRVWPAGGMFADNELLSLFPGLRVVRYEDVWAPADWQAKHLNERLVRMMAEKAMPPAQGCLWEGTVVPESGTACWDGAARLRCQGGGWLFTPEACKP